MIAFAIMKQRIFDSYRTALLAITMLVSLALILLGVIFTSGCSGAIHSRPGQAVIDCLGADQGQLGQLATEFKPLLSGDKPDWSGLYNKAKQNGKVLGGCVLSELVQDYLTARKATPTSVDDSWSARGVLEQFRTDVAGGATFHTNAGDL